MVAPEDTTWWSTIRGAAAGDPAARTDFASRYLPVVRSYLAARWRGGRHAGDVDDAAQDVFVECFRDGGVLSRADADRPGGFRALLFGVTRNVARRVEARRPAARALAAADLEAEEDGQDGPSRAFDRAWAQGVMREAARRLREKASREGSAAERRVEILRLRFEDGLPIREIAVRWSMDPAVLHREYARAREEFREVLHEAVAVHQSGTHAEVEAECERLLASLG